MGNWFTYIFLFGWLFDLFSWIFRHVGERGQDELTAMFKNLTNIQKIWKKLKDRITASDLISDLKVSKLDLGNVNHDVIKTFIWNKENPVSWDKSIYKAFNRSYEGTQSWFQATQEQVLAASEALADAYKTHTLVLCLIVAYSDYEKNKGNKKSLGDKNWFSLALALIDRLDYFQGGTHLGPSNYTADFFKKEYYKYRQKAFGKYVKEQMPPQYNSNTRTVTKTREKEVTSYYVFTSKVKENYEEEETYETPNSDYDKFLAERAKIAKTKIDFGIKLLDNTELEIRKNFKLLNQHLRRIDNEVEKHYDLHDEQLATKALSSAIRDTLFEMIQRIDEMEKAMVKFSASLTFLKYISAVQNTRNFIAKPQKRVTRHKLDKVKKYRKNKYKNY